MISYATLGVSDLPKAAEFYTQLLSQFGAKQLVNKDRIIFIGKDFQNPMLAVCVPFDEQAQHPGNGNMLAFAPGSKEAVDELYNKALELGATCDGAPGQRIPNMFYGAYVKDADNNKICFNHFG